MDPYWNTWRNILALINIGFTMQDIRHMTVADFIAYTDIYAHDNKADTSEPEEPEVREATQADIDRLFM